MDNEKQNNLWKEATKKDIMDIDNANNFIPRDTKESILNDYTLIPVHFVFDVKCDGRRK